MLWKSVVEGLVDQSVVSGTDEDWIIRLANNFNRSFNKFPNLVWTNRWLYGVWMIGNDYRNKTRFYGAYPNSLLKRYDSMFSWAYPHVLHLFSGSLPKSDDYVRFDVRQDADVKGDAEHLSDFALASTFNVIFADPPYSKEDAKKYKTPMPNRKKVIHECYKVLKPGGFLVWLDTVYPMYRKVEFKLIGTIGIIRSTNHRVRSVFIFRKQGGGE